MANTIVELKKFYLYDDFLKSFPIRSNFTDQKIANILNTKINANEPIEFLPNNPSEGSFPSSLQGCKTWEYSISMFGILPDGRRAIVLIDGIKPYFLLEKPKLNVGLHDGDITSKYTAEEYDRINNISKDNFLNEVKNRIMILSAGDTSNQPCDFTWECGKPFVGWQSEKSDYLKISFNKQSSRKKMLTSIRNFGYVTYHDDYDEYFRVVARDYDIPLCSWSTISNYKIEKLDQFKQPVFRVNINNFKKYAGEVLKNQILARDKSILLTWDIECGTQTGDVPTADNMNDKLFMIACTLHWWYSKAPIIKICFVDMPTDISDDYITVICGNEKNVILAFAYLFEKMQPDFCTGYNSSNFDYPWFIQRSYQYGILEIVCDIMNELKPFNGFNKSGVTLGHKLYSTSYDAWRRKELQKKIPKVSVNNYLSSVCPIYCYEKVKIDAETYAEGTQIQTAGCISFDLMTIMRQAYPNSEKNSLDHFLSINKLGGKKDMPVHELFRIYWDCVNVMNEASKALITNNETIRSEFLSKISRCKKEMREVAEYCVIDSYRCQELSLIRNVIADKREVAALSYTSLPDAFFRANGMKVRQMVMTRGITRNFKFTTYNKTEHGTEKYPGAYVLPPQKGLITSKLTIPERILKHKEFTDRFGFSNLNDGSFRTIPYTDISTFSNTNTNINLEIDAASLKIKCFQDAIYEHAKNNINFTVVNTDEKDINIIINNASLKLNELKEEGSSIMLSDFDIKIFTKFLNETTGRPITGLDFSSLYPSLIMAYNLSPEYTISMETCGGSAVTVKSKVLQAQIEGHKIRRIKFPYGESKKEIFGFYISHENQFPILDNGEPNPNCKFGIYPTILKELFDARNIMKVPKEYYEILNEYLDKKNDNTNKTNLIIKLCSSNNPETCLNLNEFKDFETLIEDYEELKIIKDHNVYGKMTWNDFVSSMKNGPPLLPKVERIELEDAINVILNKIDFDHAYKPPRRTSTTEPSKVKKILCAFEDEMFINEKGGITWEDIEFYFNYFDSKQKALKVFMNTFYGESGNKLSPMFVLAIAGSVTTQGQMNIKMVKEFVETGKIEYEGQTYNHNVGKFSVKYGDTDSLYIAAPESAFRDVDIEYYSGRISKEQYWSQMVDISFSYIDKIKKDVNDMLKLTSGTKFLKMSYEEVLFPVAFLAKKKYYGVPHISIPNFNPKKLFIRGLEVKKRGIAGVLKNLCEDLMWKSMRLDNNKELLELAYDLIDAFYNKKWDVDLFSQTKQFKPKSEEDIADGKGNKSVLRFVERMKARGIEIKPHERFRTVIVRKYPFEYDYRGRKVPLKIGDFMELVSEVKLHNMDIDIDYYMENGIIGQLARLTVYRDEFFIESIDDSNEEIKRADDNSYKKAKSHLNDFASRYYTTYQSKGHIYQSTFKIIDRSLKTTYKNLGLDRTKVDLLCKDWDYDTPDNFFKSLCDAAETKAIKTAKGYGKNYVTSMTKPPPGSNVKPTELITLQRLYCGVNASHMKIVIDTYRNNINIIERDFRNMFHDFTKFMSEHRRAIDIMSILINKAIGVDKMYNEPIKLENTKSVDKPVLEIPAPMLLQLSPLNSADVEEDDDAEVDDISLNDKSNVLATIKNKFPEGEFDVIFKATELQITNSFNIPEIANRLFIIYDNLYKTYLFYKQNIDIQLCLEMQLDKKYHINSLAISKESTNLLINEGIDEGIRKNIIDVEF